MYESHLKTPFADLLLDKCSFEGIFLTNNHAADACQKAYGFTCSL